MEIYISNFGIIKEAKVQLGGLTVIAGENDSGKSTVGKILFSLVKAFTKLEENLINDKDRRLMDSIEKIYLFLRKFVNLFEDTDTRELFFPPKFFEQLKIYNEKTIYERSLYIQKLSSNNLIPFHISETIEKYLAEIHAILLEDKDPVKMRVETIRKAFYSEFKGEIVHKKSDLPAIVEIRDGFTPLLKIQWSKNGITSINFHDDLSFDDATYIDSPASLQYHSFIQSAHTLLDGENINKSGLMVPLHVKDLSKKLQESIYSFKFFTDQTTDDSLKNTYKGNFYFDKDTSQFVLDRGGYTIASSNVASGIKNLGVFDILVNTGHINPKTLTILDEPEINLHPEWQIKYAKSICTLAKQGCSIIVTTHSPYMLEALYGYSKKLEMHSKFYLTFKDGEYSSFDDISNQMSKGIEKLSTPLHNLNEELDDDF